MKFQDCKLAHFYLDGLEGFEIGASAHNPFNLNTKNIDYTDEITIYKQSEIDLCGEYAKVDIVADAINLPLEDNSTDFIISSHQIEHCFNLIGTIKEYKRVIKFGGFIFLIAPKPEVCPNDKVISLEEFISRETSNNNGDGGHCSVCTLETIICVFDYLDLDIVTTLESDSKVGNGWCIVGKKLKN